MAVFDDLSRRSAGPRSLRVRGLVVAVVLVVLGVVLGKYATGDFESRFDLTIDSTAVGDGLAVGSDIKYRGLPIGRVDEIEPLGFGSQRVHAHIEPAVASVLTDDVTARFSSATVFGATVIELYSEGEGSPLREDTVLALGDDTETATVTGVFRRLADLTDVLDADNTERVLDLASRVSSEFGDSLKPFFDTAQMMAETQRAPLAWKLHRGGELADGLGASIGPVTDVIDQVVTSSEYFENPENSARAITAMSGLGSGLSIPLGDLLRDNGPYLRPLLDTLLDVLLPVALSAGTLAPAYQRVPDVISGVEDAFPNVDGRTQLQLQVIVKNMPAMAGPAEAFAARLGGVL
ncbi:MCE family protein [Rhodococcus sp. BP-149]|uniref:MlaD family protein n=1 Tax=unclassified Rhodococcus (in: high G+C Gram-positive bacteria) TaxID=192944 RepID=UPI001C9BB971|nr:MULTISPECIES: MlaD family protein [unclassified Rhodococcus (in: high G+C Gram-positive bacteria)]MBY6684874.1 MCE family protein [Rhodococcus sp. BP-288]MBY6692642.1 MCE family protein [Rhodococcus sp. BP-188]MBY6698540.1 MCE family protein [Rhodococcus sp. BP-285]MBY6701219.1 MCE family protein [Rhodococcus sp. BP-283]MBY6712220.1 MCE family protein [Rhodococcus sp. BP-160]